MIINRQNLPVLLSYSIVAVLFILTIDNSFFWDTIQLGSKHANHYLTTDFREILLPDSIDSGHIPAFGFYLAVIWKIFGRSLIVSHLAMLPFILGILWQLQRLTLRFIEKKYAGWAVLLILSDPTLLSQITLVSPDVPLVFFFLTGLNSLLHDRKKALSLSILFLFLTSMRGMMVSFCLLVADIIRNVWFSGSFKVISGSLLKRSLIYLPAVVVFISYSTYHYMEKGWIGFHENSPWAELFESVGIKGILFNTGILIWRILDFGRVGIWMVFGVLLIIYRKDVFRRAETRFLLFIFLTLLLFLSANMLWAKNLLGHRYLLPVYISFSLLCARILFTQPINGKLRIALIAFWLISVTTGNLWIYPEKTAQGWDSTLGHLPYYKVRHKTIEYMDNLDISHTEVQSFFPNNQIIDDIDLNNDHRYFADFNNLSEYVIYSNVFNISDEEHDLVKNEYSVIKHFRKGFIYMDICKKK